MRWIRSQLRKVRLWLLAKLDIYSPSGIFADEYPPAITNKVLKDLGWWGDPSNAQAQRAREWAAQLESEVDAEKAGEDRRLNVLVALHRARATANREATK